jgi:hypothetical protein
MNAWHDKRVRLIGFLVLGAVTASAQTVSTVQTFSMVGIAGGQAARVNVLNVGGAGQAAECIASLIFVDDQGGLLKTNTFAVQPGHSVSLDLLADTDLQLGANERRQIRAVVALLPAVAPPACVLAPTLEIFDRSTGRTSIVMVKTIPIPQTPTPAVQQ